MGNLLAFHYFMELAQETPPPKHFGQTLLQRSRSPDNHDLHSFSIRNGTVLFNARIFRQAQAPITGWLVFLELSLEEKKLIITIGRPKYQHHEIPLEDLIGLQRIPTSNRTSATRRDATKNKPDSRTRGGIYVPNPTAAGPPSVQY